MEEKKQLEVAALRNGTVIDHIPPHALFQAVRLLGLENIDKSITIGNNLASKRYGSKGIIKVADTFPCCGQLDRIALIAPTAVVNTIRDYKVVSKQSVCVPDEVVGIVRCNNPKCISRNEPMETRFEVVSRDPIRLKCHYCEQEVGLEDMSLM